jgi:hypothetical protein
MVTERAIAGFTASTHLRRHTPALSFDFIVNPLSTNHRSRDEREFRDNRINPCFLDNRSRSTSHQVLEMGWP